MTPLQLDFCDFWPGFDKADNFFTEVLATRYKVRICDKPDILIFSNYGHEHRLHACPRLFYTGEPGLPNWAECDYAFTFNHLDDPRHLRLPLYVIYANSPGLGRLIAHPGVPLETLEPAEEVLARKTKFCAFVVGNIGGKSTQKRVEFFHRLSQYKRVDSGGLALNNVGGPIPAGTLAKQAFLAPRKFNICFENRSLPGYTTEKLYEALHARCLPIYWGNPQVQEEFNPKCFLNYFDFPNEEALVKRIIEIDNNPQLHLEYLRQPVFPNHQPNEFFNTNRVLDFFDQIVATRIRPVGTRRRLFQFRRWLPIKQHHAYTPAMWTVPPPPVPGDQPPSEK